MASGQRPIQFRDYLPEIFRAAEVDGVSVLSTFLQAFEALFEEIQAEIEGTPDGTSGGIPDLFSPNSTPPPQFRHRPQSDADYLSYLASWIALPLRPEKSVAFNRALFTAALPLIAQRSTLPGLDALLRIWLQGDLLQTTPPVPPLLILSDLTRAFNDVDTVFQLGQTATLGVDTVLGEGPPSFFVVDLVADPTVSALRTPAGLDLFQRAARALLDGDKPAHTCYHLSIRAHTMQLAEPGQTAIDGRPGAQIGETTLLWDEPWGYDSE